MKKEAANFSGFLLIYEDIILLKNIENLKMWC